MSLSVECSVDHSNLSGLQKVILKTMMRPSLKKSNIFLSGSGEGCEDGVMEIMTRKWWEMTTWATKLSKNSQLWVQVHMYVRIEGKIKWNNILHIFDTKIEGYDDVDENGRYRRHGGGRVDRLKSQAEQVRRSLPRAFPRFVGNT